jgi:V8-like Glu-specific endopeptidase
VRKRSLIALLAALSLAAIPAAGSVGAAGPRVSEHDRIVAFWTPARQKSAIPRDFVRAGDKFVPRGKPGGGGSGGVTGASWNGGGLILKASGKVYFVMGASAYVCSGSVVNDSRNGASGKSLVLTAGHCAYDETNHAFATNWLFIPDYDDGPTLSNCNNTAYGCWTSEGLFVHNGFATAGGFNTQATIHDWAFAVVGNGGKAGASSPQLDATVGSFGITYSGISSSQKLYAFGYPAAGKYHGNDLTYCAGNIITDNLNDDLTWGMACGMTGGSSGGPWLSSFTESTGIGTLSSLNSYGYSGIKNMYGPKFNSETQAVYNAANTGTGNHTVN